MRDFEIDAMLLTVALLPGYCSGFLTRFWHGTLDPGSEIAANKLMVDEESNVITENGAGILSKRATLEIPVIR